MNRRGFALISALWFMVALSGLGLHLALSARAHRLAVANAAEGASAREAALAGAEHARARLERLLLSEGSTPRRHAWHALYNVMPETVSLGAARYSVHLSDANARLNLNSADESALRLLMTALRVDAGRADAVAQAIADWRDGDALRRPRGAESGEYAAAFAPRGPANAPFGDTRELRDVLGVDEDLYQLLAEHVTVSGTGAINPNTAADAVLRTLPGFSDAIVAELLRLRQLGVVLTTNENLLAAIGPSARAELERRDGAWRARLTFETREVEFTSESWMTGSPARSVASGTFVATSQGVLVTSRRTR
jgi:general secretion pathway protein K